MDIITFDEFDSFFNELDAENAETSDDAMVVDHEEGANVMVVNQEIDYTQTEDFLMTMENFGIEDARRQTERSQFLPEASEESGLSTLEDLMQGPSADEYSSCNLQGFFLNRHLKSLITKPYSMTYMMEDLDYTAACNDFMRLISFVELYPEPGKSELSSLLFPVFVYSYLTLLGCEKEKESRLFFELYKDIFNEDYERKDDLNTLFTIKTLDEAKSHHYFNEFLKHKYVIKLSEDTLYSLKVFLEILPEEKKAEGTSPNPEGNLESDTKKPEEKSEAKKTEEKAENALPNPEGILESDAKKPEEKSETTLPNLEEFPSFSKVPEDKYKNKDGPILWGDLLEPEEKTENAVQDLEVPESDDKKPEEKPEDPFFDLKVFLESETKKPIKTFLLFILHFHLHFEDNEKILLDKKEKVYGEEDWTNTESASLNLYSEIKTLTEQAAWDFMKELPDKKKFELAVINPGLVLGPAINREVSSSAEMILDVLSDHSMHTIPKASFPVCDVRDVALAHVKAMTLPSAANHRHIICTENVEIKDITSTLSKEFRQHGYDIQFFPEEETPASLDSLVDKISETILPSIDRKVRFDNKRNNCLASGCKGNYNNEDKVHLFSFPKDKDWKAAWMYLPRKDFMYAKYTQMQEDLGIKPKELTQTLIDTAHSIIMINGNKND